MDIFIINICYKFWYKKTAVYKNKIQISLDGLQETHDFIRGSGSFEKTMKTIKQLYDNDVRFYIHFVYNSKNYKELYELKKYLK